MLSTVYLFSIIIVDYRSRDYFPICLGSIEERVNVPCEVIVVDNNKDNRGFAKAANLGAKRAKGTYLLFLNPDTKIISGDFKELVFYLDKCGEVGVVGLKMLLGDGSVQPHSFGKKMTILKSVFNKFSTFPRLPARQDSQLSTSPDWVSGGAMAVRRDLFEKLGGFDEQFFMYFEDQDLCLRAKAAGFKIAVWDKIVVAHFGGKPLSGRSHLSKESQLKIYYESQNKFVRKHYNRFYWYCFAVLRFPWLLLRLLSYR